MENGPVFSFDKGSDCLRAHLHWGAGFVLAAEGGEADYGLTRQAARRLSRQRVEDLLEERVNNAIATMEAMDAAFDDLLCSDSANESTIERGPDGKYYYVGGRYKYPHRFTR